MRNPLIIVASFLALAGCTSGEDSAASRPDEYKVELLAAGDATNPCIDSAELSAVYIILNARLPQSELTFNRTLVFAVQADGTKVAPRGFMTLFLGGTRLERHGALNQCGGAGGVRVEGYDREMGAIGQNTVMPVDSDRPEPGEDGPARLTLAFEQGSAATIGLFFPVPLDSIERIELSNGQWIESALWE